MVGVAEVTQLNFGIPFVLSDEKFLLKWIQML